MFIVWIHKQFNTANKMQGLLYGSRQFIYPSVNMCTLIKLKSFIILIYVI